MRLAGRLRAAARAPFAPAIAVLDRLSFARKFILVALLLAGPLATVAWLQASSATERIAFARRAARGARPPRAGDPVPRRGAAPPAARRRPRRRGGPARPRARPRRRRCRRRARENPYPRGPRARARPRLAGPRRGPRPVGPARADAPGAAGRAAHAALSRALLALLLTRIGSESSLILDPDPESYWLADAVVANIPELVDAVAQAGAAAIAGANLQAGPLAVLARDSAPPTSRRRPCAPPSARRAAPASRLPKPPPAPRWRALSTRSSASRGAWSSASRSSRAYPRQGPARSPPSPPTAWRRSPAWARSRRASSPSSRPSSRGASCASSASAGWAWPPPRARRWCSLGSWPPSTSRSPGGARPGAGRRARVGDAGALRRPESRTSSGSSPRLTGAPEASSWRCESSCGAPTSWPPSASSPPAPRTS